MNPDGASDGMVFKLTKAVRCLLLALGLTIVLVAGSLYLAGKTFSQPEITLHDHTVLMILPPATQSENIGKFVYL